LIYLALIFKKILDFRKFFIIIHSDVNMERLPNSESYGIYSFPSQHRNMLGKFDFCRVRREIEWDEMYGNYSIRLEELNRMALLKTTQCLPKKSYGKPKFWFFLINSPEIARSSFHQNCTLNFFLLIEGPKKGRWFIINSKMYTKDSYHAQFDCVAQHMRIHNFSLLYT